MVQNSKKRSKSPHVKKAKKKEVYTAPKPKKPVIWGKVAPGLMMLRYVTFPSFLRTTQSRKIKNSSACVVAPVYVAVEQFHDWSTAIVENIFEIGNELHRLTLQQLKLRNNSNYPIQCVCPTFLLNANRVTILVRPGETVSTIDESQIPNMEKLLSSNHGLVVQCSGKTYAFWKDKNKYFCLIPDGFRDVDNRLPALLKSNDLKSIVTHGLHLLPGLCTIYTVKVLNKVAIPMTLENINDEFTAPAAPEPSAEAEPRESIKKEEKTPEKPAPAATPAKDAKGAGKGGKGGKKDAKKKVEEPTPIEYVNSEDVTLSFSSDFKRISDTRGILYGKEYCKDPDRIPHTIISAALFLHHFPANLWTSIIIHDIMKFSKKLYSESEYEDLLDNEDWMDRIKFPITFIKKNLTASFEKMVYGRVTSEEPEVMNVEQGLIKFFDTNDTGILAGPQLVLVWQQKSNYFMFDPKERDGLGRKWTRLFSSELGSTALAGSACATWYRDPRQLAEVYIESIALKHRGDPYRIIKIRFYEDVTKPEDEGDWLGMAENKWMIFGTKTLCDYSYADDSLRTGKAICMGISALLTASDVPEEDWDSETIDNILSEGIELFKASVGSVEPDKSFGLKNVKPLVEIGGKRVKFVIVECKFRGPMLAEPKGTAKQLKDGLVEFFNSVNSGMFTVKDISLGIWRGADNYFYLFYPYEKILGMPSQCLCDHEKLLPPMGIANAMRFKTIDAMFYFLTTSLNTKENDEYCLSPVNVSFSDLDDRPDLLEYEEFGESGAILRPFNDLHEGHEKFGVRADKQTLANLLTALGMNRINNSRNWTKEDLSDILHIGDKLFCKIYMALPECQARDYRLQWEDVVPVIGMNKFTFTRQPIEGVLEIQPEGMGEEEGDLGFLDNTTLYEEGVEGNDDELFVRPEGSYEARSQTNDLKGILKNWDKKQSDNYEAVLETDFFKIAIWKRDNLYFVFDPKASGDNGELTERRIEMGKDKLHGDDSSIMPKMDTRTDKTESEEGGEEATPYGPLPLYLEKRNYTSFDNEGSAYTAWFSNYDEFYNHIIKKTPEDYKYGKLTLHELVLSSVPLVSEDLGLKLKPGFHAVAPNHSILRGSITQSSSTLTNRDKQEICNCIVALAFVRKTHSSKMTTTLLDAILKYGDRLYTKSLNALKKTDMARAMDIDKISLEDVSPIFSINKVRFKWKINLTYNGNLTTVEMRKGTGKLGSIENGIGVIFKHKGYTMAFWRSEGSYYLYDPFETSPTGVLVNTGGLPSLQKFSKNENMFSYILSKYACVAGSNSFTYNVIGLSNDPVQPPKSPDMDPSPEMTKLVAKIPKEQSLFQPYQNDMRILKSPLSSDKIPQYGLALAAMIHSQLQFVELWNQNITHRISFLSRYLLQASDCDIEFLRTPASFNDIRSSFVIDNELICHVIFVKNIQGPVLTNKRTEIVGVNLKNALIMFTKHCRQMVLFFPGTGHSYALWRENGLYYLFGIDRIEKEMFVIASPILLSIYETLMKGIDPEQDLNNWYELRSVSISIVPVKDGICKPLTTIEDLDHGPLSTHSGSYIAAEASEPYYFDRVTEKPEGVLIRPKPSEFFNIEKGVEILYSDDILKSHKFYGTKDFYPSLQAACVEASALAKIKSPTQWTKKTLEKLLTSGINLYVKTVAVRGSGNIQVVDFKGNFNVSNQILEVNPLMPTILCANNSSKEKLLNCLTLILRKYQMAYLFTDTCCFTLILENGDCSLYFPGSSAPWKNFKIGSSCLIRFCTISDLLDRLLENGRISFAEDINIGAILFVFKN